MNETFKLQLLGATAAWCMAVIAHGDPVPVTLLEGSVESSADQIDLPSAAGGIVTIHACAACAIQTFYFAPDADLFTNGKRASVGQMREALRNAGSTPVTVHYRLKDSLITRIVLVEP